ncbi:hypothetical protein GCM10017044_16190 [Kordiimonas sediminis]|uniref:Flagellar assembly protein FliH n=1 Tax=Kordiimonas sediminis TaxID=1735581 RepID=A0A919E7X9_9PROT|nr:FliH/SctL family protein [Kordiimonas sediminis]GHF22601.1 hypothetical protein GCM10017044_16190 [Kordiimonas sediminis]
MAEPVKFTFDRAFDGGAKSRYDEDVARLQDELAQTKEAAYAEGHAAGHAQALGEIEAATLEATNAIAASAQALITQQKSLEDRLKQEMVQLSYAIASKLAPTLIRERPLAEIEGLIEECLNMARKEPRIVIRVAPALLDSLSERINTIKNASAFDGEIILIDDASLKFQDCCVEWPDGGLERKFMDIQVQVQDAVQRYVIARFEQEGDWSTGHVETDNAAGQEDMPKSDAYLETDISEFEPPQG